MCKVVHHDSPSPSNGHVMLNFTPIGFFPENEWTQFDTGPIIMIEKKEEISIEV